MSGVKLELKLTGDEASKFLCFVYTRGGTRLAATINPGTGCVDFHENRDMRASVPLELVMFHVLKGRKAFPITPEVLVSDRSVGLLGEALADLAAG
jgi:hypothetical protein